MENGPRDPITHLVGGKLIHGIHENRENHDFHNIHDFLDYLNLNLKTLKYFGLKARLFKVL